MNAHCTARTVACGAVPCQGKLQLHGNAPHARQAAAAQRCPLFIIRLHSHLCTSSPLSSFTRALRAVFALQTIVAAGQLSSGVYMPTRGPQLHAPHLQIRASQLQIPSVFERAHPSMHARTHLPIRVSSCVYNPQALSVDTCTP
eukprot:2695716-Rhodomonas_salina.1